MDVSSTCAQGDVKQVESHKITCTVVGDDKVELVID